MNALVALGLIFLIYSIGDFIADKTKAFVSMLLACAVIFTAGFWLGLPKTIFADSGLIAFAKITLCMFLIHIGTAIKINDFVKEWKTVFVTFFATLSVAGGVFFIGKLRTADSTSSSLFIAASILLPQLAQQRFLISYLFST